jgi:hypothetical protein
VTPTTAAAAAVELQEHAADTLLDVHHRKGADDPAGPRAGRQAGVDGTDKPASGAA